MAWLSVLAVSTGAAIGASQAAPADGTCTIVVVKDATPAEVLASREVERYVYLRTGRVPAIAGVRDADATAIPAGPVVAIATKDRALVSALATGADLARARGLTAQQYLVKTIARGDASAVLIVGGDAPGTLYGAYRFTELLGVRFFLHGDVVPDQQVPLALPRVDELGKPLFELRGIQPFHNFAEGPDWWNADDYAAVIGQLPKLRMNFLGLHTYSEGYVGPEPSVWIGARRDFDAGGDVKFAYPSSYHSVLRGTWGYKPKPTGKFVFGAAQLFERDAFGPDVMGGHVPLPRTPKASMEVFDRTGGMLRQSFTLAHRLGVKTSVGTETPLVVPRLVKERLGARPRDAVKPGVVQRLYEGMFARIAAAYPVDYYCLWTPEDWTGGPEAQQLDATVADLKRAMAAARTVKAPFTLATCGWVLGPQTDRTLFDNLLPKDMPMSGMNRQVGNEPVDPGFARVTGRPKWAFPWLEDDHGLTQPQLWVGRMRRDARDARKYGCTGLMGIHWRTRSVAPMAASLAQAAWDQTGWGDQEEPAPKIEQSCAVGGQSSDVYPAPVADTDDDPVYQVVRYNLRAYYLKVPAGTYAVTLKFSEPYYDKAGARVFGVKLQGKVVLDNLDIFAQAGKARALDYTFEDVQVTDGWLVIDFVPIVGFPAIAGLVVEDASTTLKINCGGAAYKDYAADLPTVTVPAVPNPPSADYYRDWATTEFGPEAAPKIAAVLARIDSRLPPPGPWVDGPGGIQPENAPWESVAPLYGFVGELEALRPAVRGAGQLARFDYWLDSFRYMKAIAKLRCTWHQFNQALARVIGAKDPTEAKELAGGAALELRRQLLRDLAEVYRYLLATVSTPGELGTVANWEEHILPKLLEKPGAKLAAALGTALPADAQPSAGYAGPVRLIVPTLRGSVDARRPVRVKAIVLSPRETPGVVLHHRKLGEGEFASVKLTHVARGVYRGEVPPSQGAAIEYYLSTTDGAGQTVMFPPTAPKLNQTVVVMP